MEQCAKCAAGPIGVGGHEDLYMHAFAGGDILLKCRACGHLWTRKHTAGESFTWLATSGSEGALLPTR